MGMYTDWNICATVKPEYLDSVEYFVQHYEWPEPLPDFIVKWRKYLLKIDCSYDYESERIYYCPPSGCAGKWDYKNELCGDQWKLCGSMKNYNNQIEIFP